MNSVLDLRFVKADFWLNENEDGYIVDGIPDLISIEDEVDDETEMEEQPEYTRDEAWVYINGIVSSGNSHYEACKNNSNIESEEDLIGITKARTTGEYKNYQLAWGHGAKQSAVIELDCLNADLNDVVKALKNFGYEKVYTVPFWEDKNVTRIAKER